MWFQREICSNVFIGEYFETWVILFLADVVPYDERRIRTSVVRALPNLLLKMNFKEFIVVHFAGPVTYDVSEFLEKNNDSLYANLSHMMSNSTNEIVKVSLSGTVFDRATTTCRKNMRSAVTDHKRVSVVFRRLSDVQQKNTKYRDQTIQNQSKPADKHIESETAVVHTMHQTEQLQRARSVYGTCTVNGGFLTNQQNMYEND